MQDKLSRRTFGGVVMASALPATSGALAQVKPQQDYTVLASWRDGDAKRAVLDFLRATTTQGLPDYVPPARRTAVFDNDGTLWTEQPLMPEVAFALARLRRLAPQHPEWTGEEPFRSALQGDLNAVAQGGVPALVKLAVATQAYTTPERFRAIVSDWLLTSRDPRFKQPYSALVYQPMLEVLHLFAAHQFQCFVVSAGGLEFLRAWVTESYGLPPDRVIGSTLELRYVVEDGRADLQQTEKIASFTDGPHKPAAIARIIGQRPLAAFGNSDGDYEMLQYVTATPGRRLGMIVHHDDAEREYAYDRSATVGKLDRALDDAPRNDWKIVSMRNDWDQIFAR